MSADRYQIVHADCMDAMREMADCSVDFCVTDPPYHLTASQGGAKGFMGKDWDGGGIAFSVDLWREVLRILKPGGYVLAFGGTRTSHRMVCAIEDAGFEIRDSIAWIYGSGFPKSLDVSKAIDKAAGAERLLTRSGKVQRDGFGEDWDTGSSQSRPRYDLPVTEDAVKWAGFGTALKPAIEPVCMGRKPFRGTVADCVKANGTGALNIDACRIGDGGQSTWAKTRGMGFSGGLDHGTQELLQSDKGRWPANVILDESAAGELDRQTGISQSKRTMRGVGLTGSTTYGAGRPDFDTERGHEDEGGGSRFFYVAKPDNEERDAGLSGFDGRQVNDGRQTPIDNAYQRGDTLRKNTHPTIKPLTLMRYLVRLVTPPGGLVLDPFAGSGTTGWAALAENFRCILVEREAEYLPIIRSRMQRAACEDGLFAAEDPAPC